MNIVVVDAPSTALGHTYIPLSRTKVEDRSMRELTQRMVRFAVSHSPRGATPVAPRARRIDNADSALQELQELGGLIFTQLLTEPAREQLSNAAPGFLNLRIQEQLLYIPWELAHTGDTFLATKFWIGRQVLSPYRPARAFRSPLMQRYDEPLRVLIIGDPTEDLPEAAAEAEYIHSLLREMPGVQLTFLGGKKSVRKIPLLSKLSGYDVVHYAGHSFYNSNDPTQSGWRLADGNITAGELSRLQRPPLLVFSNSCEGGETAEERNSAPVYDGETSGLGSAFLDAGVRNYIGAQWNVDDRDSREIAAITYQSLLAGKSSGEALCLARQRVAQPPGSTLTWASYVLYGDPTFTLTPAQGGLPVIEPPPPSPPQPSEILSLFDTPQQDNRENPIPVDVTPVVERPTVPMREKGQQRSLCSLVGALLLLGACGVAYWDLYYAQHIEYYANVTTRWGLPEGVGKLTPAQMRHRAVTLEFVRKGRWGQIGEIRVVNSRRVCPLEQYSIGSLTFADLNPLQDNDDTLGSETEAQSTCRVVFERHEGRIFCQVAYDRAGTELYILQYSEPNVAEYKNGAFAKAVRESGISHIKFLRPESGPEAGRDKELTYFDRDHKPRPDRDGSYGIRRLFNEQGLEIESLSLNVDGEPQEDTKGIMKTVRSYDALGNISEIATFSRAGHLNRTTRDWHRGTQAATSRLVRSLNLSARNLTRAALAPCGGLGMEAGQAPTQPACMEKIGMRA